MYTVNDKVELHIKVQNMASPDVAFSMLTAPLLEARACLGNNAIRRLCYPNRCHPSVGGAGDAAFGGPPAFEGGGGRLLAFGVEPPSSSRLFCSPSAK